MLQIHQGSKTVSAWTPKNNTALSKGQILKAYNIPR